MTNFGNSDKIKDAAISRMFSAGIVRELATNGNSADICSLMKQSGLWADPDVLTVGDAYESGFSHLRKSGLRNEYIYQSAIIKNVLMGKHSLRTASMMREFRTSGSRADVVILNGTSTVYEIKSERDGLQRLQKQMDDYGKIFARLYVIAAEDHVDAVFNTVPEHVGVMCLRRWNRISTLREAIDRPDQVDPVEILGSLRRSEALSILKRLGIPKPDVPNTQVFRVLKEIFADLESSCVHAAMVEVLKKSRTQCSLEQTVENLPASLHAATLMYKLKKSSGERLASALQTPIDQTIFWQ